MVTLGAPIWVVALDILSLSHPASTLARTQPGGGGTQGAKATTSDRSWLGKTRFLPLVSAFVKFAVAKLTT